MTQPAWVTGSPQSLVLSDGQVVLTWERIIGDGNVWLAREDGLARDGHTTLHVSVPPEGLCVDAARQLAADLLAAVDLVAETSPSAG
jgi:hypothetical protein